MVRSGASVICSARAVSPSARHSRASSAAGSIASSAAPSRVASSRTNRNCSSASRRRPAAAASRAVSRTPARWIAGRSALASASAALRSARPSHRPRNQSRLASSSWTLKRSRDDSSASASLSATARCRSASAYRPHITAPVPMLVWMRATSSRSGAVAPSNGSSGDDVPGLVVAEHEERGRTVARQVQSDRGRLDTGGEVGGATQPASMGRGRPRRPVGPAQVRHGLGRLGGVVAEVRHRPLELHARGRRLSTGDQEPAQRVADLGLLAGGQPGPVEHRAQAAHDAVIDLVDRLSAPQGGEPRGARDSRPVGRRERRLASGGRRAGRRRWCCPPRPSPALPPARRTAPRARSRRPRGSGGPGARRAADRRTPTPRRLCGAGEPDRCARRPRRPPSRPGHAGTATGRGRRRTGSWRRPPPRCRRGPPRA